MSGLVTAAAVATSAILAVALVITRLGAQRKTRDLQRRLAEAERAAHTDPLTGMSNRAGLYKALEQQRESARPGDHIAVILLDLDGLKQTNDMYGHDFGDSVIVEAAQRIERVAGHAACTARLGGDEFVVLMHAESSNAKAIRDAEVLAERMCARIARSELVSGMPIRCTASAGVAAMPAHRMHQLLTAADKAMYRAKSTRSSTYRHRPVDDTTERIPHRRHPLVAIEGGSNAEATSGLA
ncbi:GGDEF domain-containing protein [Saccharopolyspora griseoalba]|uniref:GGDEF domain-containing protein n=1 Tax=Saccharopolyspora griseoalba TaxID=1431848 RepID=A0ABW2LJS5_9PSEU